jgi:hypothetical protein
MTPSELHHFLKRSINGVVAPEFASSLRILLENTSAERLLTDLLFLSLHGAGYNVSREYHLGHRFACDLVVHQSRDTFVEVKQLHLKDGFKFAPANLANDLKRHRKGFSLGVLYVLDERRSTTPLKQLRFGGRNRVARSDVEAIRTDLQQAFASVSPKSAEEALLARFEGDGGLDLFAFVVRDPHDFDPR